MARAGRASWSRTACDDRAARVPPGSSGGGRARGLGPALVEASGRGKPLPHHRDVSVTEIPGASKASDPAAADGLDLGLTHGSHNVPSIPGTATPDAQELGKIRFPEGPVLRRGPGKCGPVMTGKGWDLGKRKFFPLPTDVHCRRCEKVIGCGYAQDAAKCIT